jgi:hypothetical protein
MAVWTVGGVLSAGALGVICAFGVLWLLGLSRRTRWSLLAASVGVLIVVAIYLFRSPTLGWLAHQGTFSLAMLLVLVGRLQGRRSM